jgi:hypothetical protein
VSCIGYRKVGSGLVSVCFEGEISAIHTAIERGVAVAALIDPQVKSLSSPVRAQRGGSPQHLKGRRRASELPHRLTEAVARRCGKRDPNAARLRRRKIKTRR